MKKRMFALLLCLVMLLLLLPAAAFAEEAEAEELLIAADTEAAADADAVVQEEEDVMLTPAEAEEPVPETEAPEAEAAAEPETNPVVAAEATEAEAPAAAVRDLPRTNYLGHVGTFLSPDEYYNPTDKNGTVALIEANDGLWILCMFDDDWEMLDDTVISAECSDPSVLTVWVEDGYCFAYPNKAGHATVTICSENNVSEYEQWVLFKDVTDPKAFYYDPVYWALETEITTGTTPTTFAPFNGCTRGQIVTFLWRAADKPEPTVDNPFKDIKSTDFCYKAVLWAYENGITTGTTPTTFSPNNMCTREQCVTFLWRAAGKPSAGSSAGFTDVKPGAYYEEAVNCAFERGITTGINATKFGVGLTCTRAQIVTFIYRAIA